jgi:hypothetical protein
VERILFDEIHWQSTKSESKLPKPLSPRAIGAYEYEDKIIYGRAIKTFNSRVREGGMEGGRKSMGG